MFNVTHRRRSLDIWPGFVDALSSVLLVFIFLLLVFTLGHFTLTDRLRGRERALQRLDVEVGRLAELLSLEEAKSAQLRETVGELSVSLDQTRKERDSGSAQLASTRQELATARGELDTAAATRLRLDADIASLRALKDEMEAEVARLGRSLGESQAATAAQAELSDKAQAQVELLNRQLAALRSQLTEVSAALELSREKTSQQEVEIKGLGEKLNLALASKVQELARYRSDFFGRLREALGNHPDIRVVGDRFVFQSELLFDTASAELGAGGRDQVGRLVRTLNEVASKIPSDIDWVLQIDGHTDKRPIATEQFPSNWELSTARGLAIVKYAIELGVSPKRLAATGFGEFHPLVAGATESDYAKNRRIEVKLTSR